MTILMEFPGVDGESKLKDHGGWIPLTSFSWGGRRAVRTHTGGGYGMSATYSTAQLRDIVITRQTDSASPLLWNAMIKGSPGTVKFHWLRPGSGGDPTTYLEAEFENAIIVTIATDSGGERPTESITISYEAIEFRVVNVGNALAGPQDVVGYRLGAP